MIWRFLISWAVFVHEAVAIALWASRDSPGVIVDVALIVALIFGVPLSLILAFVGRRKRLPFTIGLGTLLIGCSTGVAMIFFDGNPLVIAVLVLLSAGVMWLVLPILPNAPMGDGRTLCARCGYCLAGLTGNKCPECGEDLFTGALKRRGSDE